MFAVGILLAALPSRQYMHIPDGYLSPATAAVLFLLVLPFWAKGARSLRENTTSRSVPLIALIAAFSFVVMLFNVPLPGGTTGHAVGGALAAIVLGPEIAVVAISIALVIQAFFFGDGGVLAIGANCFNMAVVLPYVSYAIYQAIAGKAETGSRRRVWAAALGGYAGLTAAALVTGVEFGIQPALFHTAGGAPLYAPYPLSVAVPAMVIPHLLVASVVEGALTGAVVAYLGRTAPSALGSFDSGGRTVARLRGLWIALVALILATPFGLLAPGTAWGEWSGKELARMGLGYVPAGMARLAGLWAAPLPGYRVPALGDARAAYVLSAIIGTALIGLIVWAASAGLTSRKAAGPEESRPVEAPVSDSRRRRGHAGGLARSLAHVGNALEESLFAERIARQPGLLQSLDPRIKLIVALAFLLAVSLSRSLAVIVCLYMLTLLLARLSSVPVAFFVRRVWLLLPFFTGIIALPALFLVPGPAVAGLPMGLKITSTGLTTALFLVLRVGASVSAAALLILTTPWNSLLKSFAVLRVPDALVVVLGMTYRYIYLLLRLASDMLLSRQSRVVGHMTSSEERGIVAASTGVLLSRSLQLSEEVYLAMQSRGLRGAPRTMDTFRMRPGDWAFGTASAVILVAAIWLGH